MCYIQIHYLFIYITIILQSYCMCSEESGKPKLNIYVNTALIFKLKTILPFFISSKTKKLEKQNKVIRNKNERTD